MLGAYAISPAINNRQSLSACGIGAIDSQQAFQLGMFTSGAPEHVGFSIRGTQTPPLSSSCAVDSLVLWLNSLTGTAPFTIAVPQLTITAPTSFTHVPSLPIIPQFLPCQSSLLIDFGDKSIANFFMVMSCDLTGVDFCNVEEGGIYSVVVRVDNNPHIIRKALGAGQRNNLNGDVNVAALSAFSIDIRLGLGIYFLSFNFFT